MNKPRQTEWSPPRGITFVPFVNRPDRPHGVQWRVDGKRKTKTFATKEAQINFAKSLAGDAKRDGLAALRLDPSEAREWRHFRSEIGEANLADVLRIWRKYGSITSRVTLADAVAAFLKAKEGEGVAKATLGHLKPVLERFRDALGPMPAASVAREQLETYLRGLDTNSPETRRSHYKRVRTLFNWLKATRQVADNPCDGWKSPRAAVAVVSVLPVADGVKLFGDNTTAPSARELLGRLALEAFCGMRHETAARLPGSAINFKDRLITIPASIDKNRKDQFIEHAPENLWAWLAWSLPDKWCLEPVPYRNAKSAAFTRAKVEHPHNVLRHSAASYHIAMNGDAGKTAAMLTHSNLRMLWSNYRGKGGGKTNGEAWFSILPPS